MSEFAPRRILAGTDFSEASTCALRHAVRWAERTGAELIVVHVQEFPPIAGDPYFGSYNIAQIMESTREAATKYLEEHVREIVPAGVPVKRELLAGSAASSIEEAAEAAAADLVVLGTHGRGGIPRWLLGSVAERALRMASRPTLVVRQMEGRAVEPELQEILCPMNDSAVASAAFRVALAAARIFGAKLTALTVVESPGGEEVPGDLARAVEALRERLRQEIGPSADADLAHTQFQAEARQGDAAEQVIRLSRESGTDLIVLGAQHKTFFDSTVIGVTTDRVTRHAPCPVLVVPLPATEERK
jgi:nucleotide-binding universal stress UspA family protein